MKYKVGDKVKIVKQPVNHWGFVEGMMKYLDTDMTIEYSRCDSYSMEEDEGEYYWTDDMFAGLASESTIDEEKGYKLSEVIAFMEKDIIPEGTLCELEGAVGWFDTNTLFKQACVEERIGRTYKFKLPRDKYYVWYPSIDPEKIHLISKKNGELDSLTESMYHSSIESVIKYIEAKTSPSKEFYLFTEKELDSIPEPFKSIIKVRKVEPHSVIEDINDSSF